MDTMETEVKKMESTFEIDGNVNGGGMREYYESGKGDALGWGLTLILAGSIVLLEMAGLVSGVEWWNGWSVFFLGAGLITLAGSAICLSVGLASKGGWGVFFSLVLLAIGIGGLVQVDIFWPTVLLGLGILFLIGAVHKTTSGSSA